MKHDRFIVDRAASGLERVFKAEIHHEYEIALSIFDPRNAIDATVERERKTNEAMIAIQIEIDLAFRAAYDAYRQSEAEQGVIPSYMYPSNEETEQ